MWTSAYFMDGPSCESGRKKWGGGQMLLGELSEGGPHSGPTGQGSGGVAPRGSSGKGPSR